MSLIELKRNLQPGENDPAPLRQRFLEFVQAGMPGLPGEDEDRPIGTLLYHMKKRLDQNPGGHTG